MAASTSEPLRSGLSALPRMVWMLGLVSLFMDASTEWIQSLTPLFLTVGLGASAASLGLIEGVANAVASALRLLSGAFSDWLGRRKPPIVAGYGLAALAKILFPFALNPAWLLVARALDRLGKGIRGAPRDALVADVTSEADRGAAYGLRQGLDTIGAILGPLSAALLLMGLGERFRLLFALALVPAAASVLVLVLGVREPERLETRLNARRRPSLAFASLPSALWLFLGIVFLINLARFSEVFLLLDGQAHGLAPGFVPLVLLTMNVVYAIGVYPIGRLSDRIGRMGLLAAGLAALAAAEFTLGLGATAAFAFVGAGLWGLHMALSEGLLSALLADQAPAGLRGTAFGAYHLATGLALLVCNLGAGAAWSAFGPRPVWLAGGALALVALVALLVWRGHRARLEVAGSAP